MKHDRFSYRGSYLCYVLIYFFSYFAMASFSAVLSMYLTGIGKSASEMSLIVSASGLFSFAVLPFTGYLCDKVNRPRLTSMFFLVCMGVTALIFSQCRQVWALFLLDGLLMSFYNSANAVAERLATAGRYRYGTLRVWGTFGYAAGAQAAGLAVQSFPPIVLFSLVFISALIAAVGFAGAENAPLSSQPEKGKKSGGVSSFLKNPQLLLLLVIVFLCAGGSAVNSNYVTLLLSQLGVPAGGVGTALFVSTLVEIPIILFSNKFMDRLSIKTLFALTCCLFILQYGCYGFFDSAWAVLTVMILIKAIASTLMVMTFLKAVRNLAPPELTTTGLSVVNSSSSLGGIVLQNAGGATAGAFGIHTLFFCLAGLMVLALVLSLLLKVRNDQKVFA